MIYSVDREPIVRFQRRSNRPPDRSTECGYPGRDSPNEPMLPSAILDDQQNQQLAKCILERIETRLPCRVQHLAVYVTENAVILAGCCKTYYTKQIAQHAAMGVLEYERLINNIDVQTGK